MPASLAVLLVLFAPNISSSAGLKPETLAAWDQYIETVDARVKSAVAGDSAFLWIDEQPGQAQRLQHGEVIVSQIKVRRAVSHGLIHHWVGAAFIPNTTLADVLAVAHDYEEFPIWYAPTVSQANLLGRSGDEDRFTIRYVSTVLWVTAVLDVESVAHYFQVDSTRWYSTARSARIQEVHEYGQPAEHKTPPDDGNGYLWRAYGVSRYQQRDNGVYIEQESIGLSRQIPAALQWMVEPAVRRLSRDLLVKSLRQTREAVRLKSADKPASTSASGMSSQKFKD
ncbi:MAG TPA: hypothetical protein VMT15_19640 [Bryobacteraceae bacterium]|nr:hypothetical protein [Bryobacteraceae bacterium]